MSMADAMAFEAWQSLSMRERNNLLRDAKKAKNKRRFNMALGALAGGPFAIAGLASSLGRSYNGNYTPYQPYQGFQKDDRPMPKAEIVQRKKKQIRYTEGMAATSLGGAGLIGAGAGAKKAVALAPKSTTAKWAAKHSGKLKGTGGALFGAGAVVGGLANINTTKIQQDDLKRHYASELKKGDHIMKAFDAEASRDKRAKAYTAGGIIGGAGVAGYSATKLEGKVAQHQGPKKVKANNAIHRVNQWASTLANYKEQKNNINESKNAGRITRSEALPGIKAANAAIADLQDKKPPVPTYKPLMKPATAKKAGIAAGAALAGLGAVNEYHRRHGGKSY